MLIRTSNVYYEPVYAPILAKPARQVRTRAPAWLALLLAFVLLLAAAGLLVVAIGTGPVWPGLTGAAVAFGAALFALHAGLLHLGD